jgi:3-dehydroquinate synthase
MSSIQSLRMELGARSYDIMVGSGLLADAAVLIAPVLASKRAIIVSDTTVAAHYADGLARSLSAEGIRSDLLTVAPGEGSKSFDQLAWLMDALLALSPDRKTTIIALGGGVVGDLAGFAASILLRGVPFIQIPTTLLAQVDSSVGGKTAINAKAGKNLIGSFYQPQRVLIDIGTLKTLPPREMRAGYAEIIKYGLIMDAEFYRWCIANAAGLLAGDAALLQYAVATSCRCKAAVVGADERESDRRALLNFGHTFGHALEAEAGYGETLVHGEAVAIGMVMACRLSAHMGLIPPEVERELAEHLRAVGLPPSPRDIDCAWDADRICAHFAGDKKAEGGALTFVVLGTLGDARVAKAVEPALARQVVVELLAEGA